MGNVVKILAVIDPDVDTVAARNILCQAHQDSDLVIADKPDALTDLLRTGEWAAVLYCGPKTATRPI